MRFYLRLGVAALHSAWWSQYRTSLLVRGYQPGRIRPDLSARTDRLGILMPEWSWHLVRSQSSMRTRVPARTAWHVIAHSSQAGSWLVDMLSHTHREVHIKPGADMARSVVVWRSWEQLPTGLRPFSWVRSDRSISQWPCSYRASIFIYHYRYAARVYTELGFASS